MQASAHHSFVQGLLLELIVNIWHSIVSQHIWILAFTNELKFPNEAMDYQHRDFYQNLIISRSIYTSNLLGLREKPAIHSLGFA